MTFAHNELLRAFREDHARLGHRFHELSRQLRDGDIDRAIDTAHRLDEEGGTHIAFEEQDFYPLLAPHLTEGTVERMLDEHWRGYSVVHAVLKLAPGSPISKDLRDELLKGSQTMELHIAECGELFGVMGRISPDLQNALYRRLVDWRQRRPTWTQVRNERQC